MSGPAKPVVGDIIERMANAMLSVADERGDAKCEVGDLRALGFSNTDIAEYGCNAASRAYQLLDMRERAEVAS